MGPYSLMQINLKQCHIGSDWFRALDNVDHFLCLLRDYYFITMNGFRWRVHDYTAEFTAVPLRPPSPVSLSSFPGSHSPVFVSSADMLHAAKRTLQMKHTCTKSISLLLRTLKIFAIIVFFETLTFSSWSMLAARPKATFRPCLTADGRDPRNCPFSPLHADQARDAVFISSGQGADRE